MEISISSSAKKPWWQTKKRWWQTKKRCWQRLWGACRRKTVIEPAPKIEITHPFLYECRAATQEGSISTEGGPTTIQFISRMIDANRQGVLFTDALHFGFPTRNVEPGKKHLYKEETVNKPCRAPMESLNMRPLIIVSNQVRGLVVTSGVNPAGYWAIESPAGYPKESQ